MKLFSNTALTVAKGDPFYIAAAYMIAWGPYAFLAMWVTFSDVEAVPYILFDTLGFFAKTSFLFNPLIYLGTNKLYR